MHETSPDHSMTRPRRRRRGAALIAAAFFAPAVAAVVPIAATSAGAAPTSIVVVGDLATVDVGGTPTPLNDQAYAFGTGANFASIRAAITANFGSGKVIPTAVTFGTGIASPTQLAASGANVYVTAARPDFTTAEVTALNNFVTSGGSVILFGNSNETNASNPTTAFGFDLNVSRTYEATCTYTPPNPVGSALTYDLIGPNIPADATADTTDFVPRAQLHPGTSAVFTNPFVGASAPFGAADHITAQHTVTTLSTIPASAQSILDYGVPARLTPTFSTPNCPANAGTPAHNEAAGTWSGLTPWATALASAPTFAVIPHGVYGGNPNSGVVIATSDTDTFSNAYDFDGQNRALGLNTFAYIVNSIPDPASQFTTVTPTRIVDTRQTSDPIGAGSTKTVQITGHAGVPANATSVAINVTAVDPTATGYLTVYPSTIPGSSNVNFYAGKTTPNFVVTGLGGDGSIKVFNSAGTTQLLIDVVGYSAPGGTAGLTSVTPARISDTRTGVGGKTGPLAATEVQTIQVTGNGGIPAGATAVVANITAVDPTASAYLTAYSASASTRPVVSSVNFYAGKTTSNYAVVPLSGSGAISIYNDAGSTQVLVDVIGYYSASSTDLYTALATPQRALDARGDSAFTDGDIGTLTVAGTLGVPANATGVIVNLTAVDPTANAYLTVYPANAVDPSPPDTSSLNFYADTTRANLVLVKLGVGGTAAGKINIFNAAGTTGVLVDIVGYITAPPA